MDGGWLGVGPEQLVVLGNGPLATPLGISVRLISKPRKRQRKRKTAFTLGTPTRRQFQALSNFSNLASSFIASSTFRSFSAARRLSKSSLTFSF